MNVRISSDIVIYDEVNIISHYMQDLPVVSRCGSLSKQLKIIAKNGQQKLYIGLNKDKCKSHNTKRMNTILRVINNYLLNNTQSKRRALIMKIPKILNIKYNHQMIEDEENQFTFEEIFKRCAYCGKFSVKFQRI